MQMQFLQKIGISLPKCAPIQQGQGAAAPAAPVVQVPLSITISIIHVSVKRLGKCEAIALVENAGRLLEPRDC